MKQNIIKTINLLLIVSIAISCTESYLELNKGETPLAMNIDHSEVILNAKNAFNAAVSLSWTSGTNKGTNCAINYALEIDRAGNNFAGKISQELGKNIYTMSFTHEELNTMLKDSFSITNGESVSLELRIMAALADKSIENQFSEPVVVNVKTYKPVSSTLYLIGDATPGGWSLDEAAKMNAVTGDPGAFVWTGDLLPGKLKFLTTNTSDLPAYCKDGNAADLKLILRESGEEPDEQFDIETSGTYRITVDIVDLEITIEMTTGPKYNHIYFVGSFTNWSFVEMRQDPVNSFVFRYGAVLTWNGGCEFKFGSQSGSWENMYHPTIANAPYTHTGVLQNSSNDNKWALTQTQCGKPYKIALNITEGSERFTMSEFTPFESLYLMGDATPGGWTIGNAVAMTKDGDYAFTWHGSLTAGSMKITCDRQSDWMGAWFMSATDGEEPTGEEQIMTFVDKINDSTAGSVDRKWKITQAGAYTITCNQLTETITIVKQ